MIKLTTLITLLYVYSHSFDVIVSYGVFVLVAFMTGLFAAAGGDSWELIKTFIKRGSSKQSKTR